MFATNNQIRTDDAHPIYDVNTGKRVNMSKDIQIGDHVWIGYGATILSGSAIGSGSVIGAGSIVRNKFPNNCVIAGTPAKVVKKDIFWERPLLLNMSEEVVYSEEERRQKNYCKNTMETE
ncbi:acyltransferase [Actinobacillus pleuropneumoniae]